MAAEASTVPWPPIRERMKSHCPISDLILSFLDVLIFCSMLSDCFSSTKESCDAATSLLSFICYDKWFTNCHSYRFSVALLFFIWLYIIHFSSSWFLYCERYLHSSLNIFDNRMFNLWLKICNSLSFRHYSFLCWSRLCICYSPRLVRNESIYSCTNWATYRIHFINNVPHVYVLIGKLVPICVAPLHGANTKPWTIGFYAWEAVVYLIWSYGQFVTVGYYKNNIAVYATSQYLAETIDVGQVVI